MSPKHAFSWLLLWFMRRTLFSFLQIIKAPRSFNKEAETRKVTCPFITFSFFNFFIIRISNNCKGVYFDDDHSNVPPGDLHVDSDHGSLLPLLDSYPHLQHLGCFWASWIWQLRQNILRKKIFQPLNHYDTGTGRTKHLKTTFSLLSYLNRLVQFSIQHLYLFFWCASISWIHVGEWLSH